MKIKIIGIFFILLILVIPLGCVESKPNSSTSIENPMPTISSPKIQNVLTPTPISTTPIITQERNLIIVIDATESTKWEIDCKESNQECRMTLEEAILNNSLNILKNIDENNIVGIIKYSGAIDKIDIQLMNTINKQKFEDWINNITPDKDDKIPRMDIVIRTATDMLSKKNGTKETLVLSDGQMNIDQMNDILEAINETNNQGIEIQFIQIVPNDIYEIKELDINPLYEKLAKASRNDVIGLRPNEIMSINDNAITITPTYPPELKYIEMYNMTISEIERVIERMKLYPELYPDQIGQISREEDIKQKEERVLELQGRIKLLEEAINASMTPRIIHMNRS